MFCLVIKCLGQDQVNVPRTYAAYIQETFAELCPKRSVIRWNTETILGGCDLPEALCTMILHFRCFSAFLGIEAGMGFQILKCYIKSLEKKRIFATHEEQNITCNNNELLKCHMTANNTGSGSGLLPDGIKPLHESLCICCIYLGTISQQVSKLLFCINNSKIILLRLLSHLPMIIRDYHALGHCYCRHCNYYLVTHVHYLTGFSLRGVLSAFVIQSATCR